jgi:hypothetical protein
MCPKIVSARLMRDMERRLQTLAWPFEENFGNDVLIVSAALTKVGRLMGQGGMGRSDPVGIDRD